MAMSNRRLWLLPLLALIALWASGCSDFVDATQPDRSAGLSGPVTDTQTVGQTFVARHGGLNGIQVWMALQGSPNDGVAVLHVLDDPASTQDLASASLPAKELTQPSYHTFAFAPLAQSNGRDLYFVVEARNLSDDAALVVGRGQGTAYLDGAMYRAGEPRDKQISFRLQYAPLYILLDLVKWMVTVFGVGLAVVALFVLPGWALLAWLMPEDQLAWAKLGIAVGLSLAVYPLLFLWTDIVGLHLGSLYAWLPAAAGLAALVWRYRTWRPWMMWQALRQWASSDALWPDVALLIAMGLVLGVRLLIVRALDVPLWGDSYQHTMITQLLVDNGGLFNSWEPYAPLQSLTYHFGFHSVVAVFHWLTGIEVVQAMVWVGQILNGLAVLVLYPLAVRVSGNRWAGVGAVLVAGLLSPMPMSYVNWGRYTQLAGQAILPAAVLVSWLALESPRRDRRLAALSWIAAGGLALTHYRVLIFYVIFVLAWALVFLRRETWRRVLSRLTLVGIGAAVLFVPWFAHTYAGEITRSLGQKLSTGVDQLSSYNLEYNTIGDLASYLPPFWWLVLAVAVAVGLWQRKRGVLLISLWWFLLLIATNPAWFRLSGTGAISNFALFIAAYIPAGVLIGDMLGQIMARAGSRRWAGALAALLVVGAGVGGARARIDDLQVPQHALVTRPDMRAMAWIRENTPKDAQFLVNSFFAYGDSSIVGSDGGWWLPLLAKRANTVPPLNYGTEREPWPGYRQWVNELARRLRGVDMSTPATLTLLRECGVTHVYVGQRQGRVNYTGPDVLDPEALLRSTHYRLVYRQDRVWVFEIVW
jgi:hypothetical protein